MSATSAKPVLLDQQVASDMLDAFRALRTWIQAVPQDTVLPAMPGVDGDWLDETEHAFSESLKTSLAPAAEVKESRPVNPQGETVKAAFLIDKSLPAGTLLYPVKLAD